MESHRRTFSDRKKVLPNILEAIGQTPMVRLNKVPKLHGVNCEVFVKCEYFNPGGSAKDRISYRMVQDAEAAGILKPGCTIIEPTSGNTGIGLAMAAAVRGYKCIIVMSQKMSNEKLYTLHALGAEIIRTPIEAGWNSPEGTFGVASRMVKKIPNGVMLNQGENPGNALAHYDETATEIWEQTDEKLDYLFIGVGTGGTITGIGRKFKEISPNTQVIGVDPFSSILARPEDLNETKITSNEVEGLGSQDIPEILDYTVIDEWVKTDDDEAFKMSRELIREEGILCGGSSGAVVSAALKYAKNLPADKRVVVLLPDGIRNYMTKFVSDHWMEGRGFMEPPAPKGGNKWWWNLPVTSLGIEKIDGLSQGTSCQETLDLISQKKLDIIPVISSDKFTGYVTMNSIMTGLISGEADKSEPADKLAVKSFTKVEQEATLGRVSRVLEKEPFVVIITDKYTEKFVGIVTQKDIYKFITTNKNVSF